MELVKRMNKGVILTIIILTILVVYIITIEMGRNQEKGKIEEVCEQYLAFEDKYTVLPKEYQSLTNKIPKEKLTQYQDEMAKELKKLIVNDENVYELQRKIIATKLEEQIEKNKIFTSKKSKLVDIIKYDFKGDQVTVTMNNAMELSWLEFNKEEEKLQNGTNRMEEVIALKKENGEWKVIYANVGMLEAIRKDFAQIEME